MSSSPSLPAWPLSSAEVNGAKGESSPPPPWRESPDANKRGGGNGGKADKKWTWKKPKGKPKRPLSAYNIFFRHERERMLVEEEAARAIAPQEDGVFGSLPGKKRGRNSGKSKPKVGYSDLAKHIAERWADLDEPSRSSSEELAAEDKRRYLVQLRRWEMEQDALGIPIKRRRGRKAQPRHQTSAIAAFAGGSAKRANSRRLSSDSVDSLDMSVASAPSHMQYSSQYSQQYSRQQHRRSVDSWDLDCCVERSSMEQSSMMEPLPVDAVPSSLSPYVENSVGFPANNSNANTYGNKSASSFDGSMNVSMSLDAATSERVRNNFAKLQRIYGGVGSSDAAIGGARQRQMQQMSPPPQGLLSNWSSSSISMTDSSLAHIQSSGGTLDTLDSDHYIANQTKSEELEYEELGYHDPYSPQAQQESSHHDGPYSQVQESHDLEANDRRVQQQQWQPQTQSQSQSRESFLSDDELRFLTSGPSVSSGLSSGLSANANANNVSSSFSGGGGGGGELPDAMEGGAAARSEGEERENNDDDHHHHSSLKLDDATVDFLTRSVHAVEDDHNNNAAGSKQQKSGAGNRNDCSMMNADGNGASLSNMGLSLSDLTGGAPLRQNPFTPHMA